MMSRIATLTKIAIRTATSKPFPLRVCRGVISMRPMHIKQILVALAFTLTAALALGTTGCIDDDSPALGDVTSALTVQSTLFNDTIWYNEDFAGASDASGNLYVAGYGFFGPPQSDYHARVTKFGVKGHSSWTRTVNVACQSCPGNESWLDVALSANGSSVYVAGYGPSDKGDFDWRIAKYTSAGTLVWQMDFGTASSDRATGIDYDDATDTVTVAGTWGTTGQFLRMSGATGATLSAILMVASDVSVDPTTGAGAPGGAIYVAGGLNLTKMDLAGAVIWTRALPSPFTTPAVDVDLISGAICVGGSSYNFASSSSASDGWMRRYNAAGGANFTATYNNGAETFYSVAAKHGDGGCIASGEIMGGTATDMLVVDYTAVGVLADDDIADHSSLDNPGWHAHVRLAPLLPARAVVIGRSHSQFGGPSPLPFSYDGWIRWLSI